MARSRTTVDDVLREHRLLLVAGKGGVGRSTVASALAVRAASLGRRVLLVDVEGKRDLARLCGAVALTTRPEMLTTTGVLGCTVAADAALIDYLDDHGLSVLGKRLVSSGAVDVIANAAPGIKDLLVLGRIKGLLNTGDYDLIVVDTPASGHAVSFLQGPRALAELAAGGVIRTQADEVLAMLDGSDCRAVLVALPEETPVNETVELAAALTQKVAVRIGPVIVNGVLDSIPQPPPAEFDALSEKHRATVTAALTFERSRRNRQLEQVRRLSADLAQTPIMLPLLPSAGLGPDDVRLLADVLGPSRVPE